MDFKLQSDYKPQGDQGRAIEQLMRGIFDAEKHQVLLGVTGSGKTYTMAKIIEQARRPAGVIAPNKSLCAQLYHEFKNFFPQQAGGDSLRARRGRLPPRDLPRARRRD